MTIDKITSVVPISAEVAEEAQMWRDLWGAIERAAEDDRRLTAEIGPWHGPRYGDVHPAYRLVDDLRRRGRLGVLRRSRR